MGVDLKLHPLMYDHSGAAAFPHVGLELERRRELWSAIEAAKIERPLGKPFGHYDDDTGYEERTDNPYGSPVTYATAGDLTRVVGEYNDRDPFPDRWNRAAVAYLAELPPETRVVLWWH